MVQRGCGCHTPWNLYPPPPPSRIRLIERNCHFSARELPEMLPYLFRANMRTPASAAGKIVVRYTHYGGAILQRKRSSSSKMRSQSKFIFLSQQRNKAVGTNSCSSKCSCPRLNIQAVYSSYSTSAGCHATTHGVPTARTLPTHLHDVVVMLLYSRTPYLSIHTVPPLGKFSPRFFV